MTSFLLSPIERIWTQQRINSRIKNNNKKSSPFLLFPSPQGKKKKKKKEERMKEMGMIPSKTKSNARRNKNNIQTHHTMIIKELTTLKNDVLVNSICQ